MISVKVAFLSQICGIITLLDSLSGLLRINNSNTKGDNSQVFRNGSIALHHFGLQL